MMTRPDAERLREQRRAFVRLVRAVRGKPGVEEVHRLRVVTRRLRGALKLVAAMPGSAPARRAQRRLRRLGRALGERRMWDVAFEDLHRLRLDAAALVRRREAASRLLARAVDSLPLGALRRDLKAAAKLLRAVPPERVAQRARRLRRRLAAAVARPPRGAEARHRLRIRVKNARYFLESCGIPAAAARRLQALLGREHDLRVLQQLAGPVPRAQQRERLARAGTDRIMAPALRRTIALLDAVAAAGKRPFDAGQDPARRLRGT